MWSYNRLCSLHDRWDKWIHPKKLLDAVGAQDVVVSHRIIHREKLCIKVLAFAEAMKHVVQCANYIRARGLNHRQFKAFLQTWTVIILMYISLLHVGSEELPL